MPWASSQTLDRIKHTFRKISIDTQPNFVCINVEDNQEITSILKHLKDIEDFRYFIDFHVIDFPKEKDRFFRAIYTCKSLYF